ncbi:hypothetical protein Ddc_19222 [Ditylenchus destructor]|nr:hypothetical protein Ddc_19222 [Ditylenchus destructor]
MTLCPSVSRRHHKGKTRTYNNHFNALSASESHLNANGIQTLARLVENLKFATVSGKYFHANGKEIRNSAGAGKEIRSIAESAVGSEQTTLQRDSLS